MYGKDDSYILHKDDLFNAILAFSRDADDRWRTSIIVNVCEFFELYTTVKTSCTNTWRRHRFKKIKIFSFGRCLTDENHFTRERPRPYFMKSLPNLIERKRTEIIVTKEPIADFHEKYQRETTILYICFKQSHLWDGKLNLTHGPCVESIAFYIDWT